MRRSASGHDGERLSRASAWAAQSYDTGSPFVDRGSRPTRPRRTGGSLDPCPGWCHGTSRCSPVAGLSLALAGCGTRRPTCPRRPGQLSRDRIAPGRCRDHRHQTRSRAMPAATTRSLVPTAIGFTAIRPRPGARRSGSTSTSLPTAATWITPLEQRLAMRHELRHRPRDLRVGRSIAVCRGGPGALGHQFRDTLRQILTTAAGDGGNGSDGGGGGNP